MKLGILKTWIDYHNYYVLACEELEIDYEVIDILDPNWIEIIKSSTCDGFLCRPPMDFQERKTIFDEKLYFINKILNKHIYPSYDEQFIYENKRNMAYFLQSMNLPHAKTSIFGRKEDALSYLENCSYPVVFKSNIGSASTGVEIIRNKKQAVKIIRSIFGSFNELFTVGKILFLKSRRLGGIKIPTISTAQRFYAIVQEYHKLKWEWRIIKIGDSYFGHQKLLNGDFASGSGMDSVGWVAPPEELLLLIKDICEKGKFYSMSVDIFETVDGDFLINELQSLFGTYDRPQMYIDGVPGRYIFKDGLFIFEEGEDFNKYKSNILRVKHFVSLLENRKENV